MLQVDQLVKIFKDKFPDSFLEVTTFHNIPTLHVRGEEVSDVLRTLKTDPRFAFNFLADLTAVDHLKKGGHERYSVVYHLLNQHDLERITLHAWVSEDKPELASANNLWRTADWQEREVYDLFGIIFIGHPNMIRILNPEDFGSYPLRKDYPLRGRGERQQFPVIERSIGSKWQEASDFE